MSSCCRLRHERPTPSQRSKLARPSGQCRPVTWLHHRFHSQTQRKSEAERFDPGCTILTFKVCIKQPMLATSAECFTMWSLHNNVSCSHLTAQFQHFPTFSLTPPVLLCGIISLCSFSPATKGWDSWEGMWIEPWSRIQFDPSQRFSISSCFILHTKGHKSQVHDLDKTFEACAPGSCVGMGLVWSYYTIWWTCRSNSHWISGDTSNVGYTRHDAAWHACGTVEW